MAHELTEHVLILFATAVLRYRQGIPDRCQFCGSYHFELWADEPGALLRHSCAGTPGVSGGPLLIDRGGQWHVAAIEVAAEIDLAGGVAIVLNEAVQGALVHQ
jgi:hypothetical protein